MLRMTVSGSGGAGLVGLFADRYSKSSRAESSVGWRGPPPMNSPRQVLMASMRRVLSPPPQLPPWAGSWGVYPRSIRVGGGGWATWEGGAGEEVGGAGGGGGS